MSALTEWIISMRRCGYLGKSIFGDLAQSRSFNGVYDCP